MLVTHTLRAKKPTSMHVYRLKGVCEPLDLAPVPYMSQSGAEVDLMDADVDFSINTNAAIISGGGLGTRPWVCETVSVNGDEFIHLDKQCKMLAKAMGISSKERWPWHGRDIVAYISDKRDEAVNKHVFEQLQSDDPLGDEVKTPEKGLSEFSVRRAGTLRQQALQKNEAPEIVNGTECSHARIQLR
jgi:hypothetical protein